MRTRLSTRVIAISALVVASGATGARAQSIEETRPALENAYAILVGSNEGGAGQQTLRYAESDATMMRDALIGVGGYDSDHVTLLRSPSVASLERSLARIRRNVEAHRTRGESTQFVFYYSGHARAQGLHLGAEELRLSRLRALLEGIDAALTFVVLDACQSGAYSRVRGVEPAADFSFNSVEELRSNGLVVMASSSGEELSQESETLRGGFFTHHLVVGLRGAADSNADGQVTLDEVYAYAYAHTLSDTSRTAVGSQHVTLETELTGYGALPMSYPAAADSHLLLPPRLEGRALIQHLRSGAVVAEVEKARGDAVRLALPEGHYLAIFRGERTLHECDLRLRTGAEATLELRSCTELDPATDARPRGDDEGPIAARWGIEFSFGMGGTRLDAYTESLNSFGFESEGDVELVPRASLAVERRLPHKLGLVLRAETLGSDSYERLEDGPASGFATRSDFFHFSGFGLGLALRGTQLFHAGEVGLYGEAGAGFGFCRSRFEAESQAAITEFDFGYALSAAGGVRWMPTERFGILMELGYTYAPILENRIGDVHDLGGFSLLFGIRGEVRR